MSVKLLTEHHLEFLSLTGGCIGSSESTLVKMPHCWKSHVTAQLVIFYNHLVTVLYLPALVHHSACLVQQRDVVSELRGGNDEDDDVNVDVEVGQQAVDY